MNYTKGLWKRIDNRQVGKSDDGIICTCWYFGNKGSVAREEAEANAQLIAAAPEMLDALVFYTKNGSCKEGWEKIIAAIEKATGKTWDEIEEEQ